MSKDQLHILCHQWKTDPETRFMKATLPSGRIVGFAKWNFFSTNGPQNPFPTEFPPAGNPEFGKWLFGEFARVMNEKMLGKKYVYMHVLVVDPEFQRHGIGKRLLEWGLKLVDDEGLETYIDASPEGRGLYEKLGWKTINVLDMDLSKWGGKDERSTAYSMIRPIGGKTV
ncbi:hypothetical protein ONS95_000220 [Cadophora gregata]|uniref:uncharacterized protein n=1 Tax=Cadophora gregata TaxID=51156 RepID=UPI0026DAF616|nr:uncharacterized protein ONS95_000220 [Cadophora gregata]KAK0128243.1 hypothetical protein ONS95_000220 [Cadophora gregata]